MNIVKKFNLNLLLTILGIILLASAVVFAFVSGTICLGYNCYLSFAVRNSKPETVYRQDRGHLISSYQLNDMQILLNVKKINIDDSSENPPVKKIEQIKSLYQPRFSTYPEVVSREIICQDKYWPSFGQTITENLTVHYAVGQLTDRLTFGACADDLIKYHGIQAFYRCASPPAEIELTVAVTKQDEFPQDFFNRLTSSIACPNFFFGLPVSFSGILPELFHQQTRE